MHKIAVLGASGMLGRMLVEYFSRQPDCSIVATVRDQGYLERAASVMPEVKWARGWADHRDCSVNFDAIGEVDWIINAVGIIKPLIKDDDAAQVERALWVNGMLPHKLGEKARRQGIRVLQIATDCVFSGVKGGYDETDPHDALDVYGKTKSLGECHLPNVHHLRCSIIGPEVRGHRSLLDWFLTQPEGATVKGFSNHDWNGVTTLQFARLCHGIITRNFDLPHLLHVIPEGTITKAAMLQAFAASYRRPDIRIEVVEAGIKMDRTLTTRRPDMNGALWAAAGHPQPLTVEAMIREMSEFPLRLKQD